MIGTMRGFPETYRELETAHLLDVFEAGPGRLERAIAGLDAEALGARPFEGKWSIREIVLHVADSELMGTGRIRKVLAEPGAPLSMYSQDHWAHHLGYQAAGAGAVTSALELLGLLRRWTGGVLREAPAGVWTRSGWHAELGVVSLRQLLELYADHVERHLEQIRDRRAALGVPLELPALLPERLY